MKSMTPLMKQYHEVKRNFGDALLFFQVGDFYELFYEDAKTAASVLAIALTSRGKDNGKDIPLCGVPMHASQQYIAKLVKAGFKVALCNQLEPPAPGRIVKRGIVNVFTPGTLTDETLVDQKKSSYIFSFFPMRDALGLLFAELLTAQLYATLIPNDNTKALEAELIRFLPDEVITTNVASIQHFVHFFKALGYPISFVDFELDQQRMKTLITNQFKPEIAQYINKQEALVAAFSCFDQFLSKNEIASFHEFKQLHLYQTEDYLIFDSATQKNLELIKNSHDNSSKDTLLAVIDNAVTAMGSRMIRKWLLRPLVSVDGIRARQDAIEWLLHKVSIAQELKKLFSIVGDLERVVGRIMLSRATVHDYLRLQKSLVAVPEIKHLCEKSPGGLVKAIGNQIHQFGELKEYLDQALNQDEQKNWVIAQGFDEGLDSVRILVNESKKVLLKLEQSEQQKTKIETLKIKYNNLHGYYFELSKAKALRIPDYFKPIQSLVNRQRFVTEELNKLQADIINATQTVDSLEKELFDCVKKEVNRYRSSLRRLSVALAHLDGLFGLAMTAYIHGYTKPIVFNENCLEIYQGKHPVLAAKVGAPFVANDCILNNEQSLLIITGPNMGGKSTYLRQVALLTIMAHMGSFIPSESATIGIRDRIFTRIGASDNVSAGKSTFLVEMEEVATICHYATDLSLIILDEVGRGTSTYDGIALAHALLEHIAEQLKARCLFATHFHELTALHQHYSVIAPFHVACKRTDKGIIFLYSVKPGVAEGSFGLQVARLAHVPEEIVCRAEALHNNYHQKVIHPALLDNALSDNTYNMVTSDLPSLTERERMVLSEIKELDYNELSPKKAFDLLWKMKEC